MSHNSTTITSAQSHSQIDHHSIDKISHITRDRTRELAEDRANRPGSTVQWSTKPLPEFPPSPEGQGVKSHRCKQTTRQPITVCEEGVVTTSGRVILGVKTLLQIFVGIVFLPVICLAWIAYWITPLQELSQKSNPNSKSGVEDFYCVFYCVQEALASKAPSANESIA